MKVRFTTLAILAALLLPLSLHAQITFQRTYGGAFSDVGQSVEQTSDGGYIIAGYTNSYGAGGMDVYLLKTDAHGDTLWTRTYGGEQWDEGCSVQQTYDGGYVVTGYTESFGAGGADVYLIRTKADGDTLWTRAFGGPDRDEGRSVRQTADSGFVIAGYTGSFGAGDTDVYLIKTNANGDTSWTRTFGGIEEDEGYSVQQTVDGGYVVAGGTESFGAGDHDIYLVKTNAQGDAAWTRTFGGASSDRAYSVHPTADSGYVVAGYTDSYGAGSADAYLIKTDVRGETAWSRTYGGAGLDYCYSVEQTTDHGYILAGSFDPAGADGRNVYLAKTEAGGDTLWTRTFGGSNGDIGYSVQETADTGYVIAGWSISFGAGDDAVYLVKTDALGRVAIAEPKASPTRTPTLSLSCKPNPFTGATTVRLSPSALRHSPLTLRMYDSQGRLVHSSFGIRASSFRLDLRSMPAGAYFIRCDVAGEHASTRVILQR
jgi:hypothetical protein